MRTTNFSAEESSLGYYHQIRYSLYLLLQKKDKDNPSVKLENLDDIVIEDINCVDLYQTKLHINSVADLTDRSADFWKTIRVWSEAITSNLIDVENTLFTLITTSSVGKSSFLKNFKIGFDSADFSEALKIILQISEETTNEANKKGYEAFRNLTEEQQKKLIESIVVIDSSLSVEDTLVALKKELKFSSPVGKIDIFLERLEGWWFQQCISMLCKKRESISLKELHNKVSDIRETFQMDNLPDDFADPINIDETELPNYEDRIFVRQLKLIAVRNNVLRNAISDFRRAFDQRSKWLREDLTNIEEYEKYEKQLQDYWNNIFSIIKDECEDLTDAELESIGRDFYKKYYIDTIPPYKIRDKFQSQYLTRGSCHMLADDKKIGWHPKFETLLEK
ncbi:hypothetical protein SDC9_15977 [bioreactor metagenome]|uniref:ABC-three component systems C-terminal domain-containing protein n=1 Tax=bioreactor metagenome TaxID=1076179 RepID=A0A644TVK4_9ZZZZ